MTKKCARIALSFLIIAGLAVFSHVRAEDGPQALRDAPAADKATAIKETADTASPGTPQKAAAVNNKKDSKISLDLKGIDIVELLKVLSLKTGFTIVPTKGVSGRVNIYLNNLTFDDAFNIILLSQDLAAYRKGDIINVMTSQEYEKLYGRKYTDNRKVKVVKLKYAKPSVVFTAIGNLKSDIGKIIADEASGTIFMIDVPQNLRLMEETIMDVDRPLESASFELKYAKPADIKAHLSAAVTPGLGEVLVDEKSGKIVVYDLSNKMAKIRRMVKAFDSAPLQVFIEAEIVQVILNDQFQRGVDWQYMLSGKSWQKWLKIGTIDLKGFFTSGLTSPVQQIYAGTLSKTNYTALIDFLQTYGDTKTLSRPRLAVVDNQEAKVLVGTRQAYVSQSLSQAQTTTVTSESVQFVDVGVKLNVVPSISSDGFIVMKIRPEVSTVESTLTTYLQSQIPIVSSSEAETVVKVKDGTMIVLAGLMKEENTDDISGWPYLSKLTFFGMAFGKRTTEKKNTEIIIFITPHIITGEAPVEDHTLEDIYPPDVLPKDLKDDIIDNKIKEIDLKKKESVGGSMDKSKKASGAAVKKSADGNINIKMKGLKNL
ncbi:MAG: hypothetical protein PHP46_04175 [Candidatus Omnitrophica bacterium]|nr:hypothetical protein [Candidatus Omnitrophota bacterium]